MFLAGLAMLLLALAAIGMVLAFAGLDDDGDDIRCDRDVRWIEDGAASGHRERALVSH